MEITGFTTDNAVGIRWYEKSALRMTPFGDMQPDEFSELYFSFDEARLLYEWMRGDCKTMFRGLTVNAYADKEFLNIHVHSPEKVVPFEGKETIQKLKQAFAAATFRLGDGVDASEV